MLTILQVLMVVQEVALPWNINPYIFSMVISILVSVTLTLRKPADPEDARRHYLIRNAQLSDSVIREARTIPNALPRLFKGCHQAKRVMMGGVISVEGLLLLLCMLFYSLIPSG